MKIPRIFAASLILGVTAAACAPAQSPATPGGQAPAPSQQQPFTLRVGISAMQATLDAQAIIGSGPRRYGLYDGMLNQDENGKVIPGLASEWKNVNATTWQFKLTPGRKFSDGSNVTVEDLKFNWDRVTNIENKLGVTGRVPTVDRAEIVDPQTINIITKEPDGLLLKRVAAIAILSKSFVEKTPASELAVKALGTGPFMVKEFVPSDHLTLIPNPHSLVKPNASEVIIRNVPEASARVAGLRAGELDLVNAVPVSSADQIKSGGFQIVNFNKGTSTGAIMFTNLEGSPLIKTEIRQALNYAVDKESIAKNIYLGYATPATQIVQKDSVGYDPNIKSYPYDVNKAKQLLAQGGYPNGFSMKMDVFASSAETTQMFLFLQDAFKGIGVQTEINSATDSSFNTDRFYGRVARNPLFSQGLNNSPALDADFAISWFRSNRPEAERWYINPEFDAAYAASQVELDETKRAALLQKAVKILVDDPPWLYLIDGFSLWGASGSLDNVIVRGDGEPRYDLVTKK